MYNNSGYDNGMQMNPILMNRQMEQPAPQDTFSRYLFDSKELVDEIKHYLHCEEQVEEKVEIEGQEVIQLAWRRRIDENGKQIPPPMNEIGYNFTMSMVAPMLNKVISGSNFDEEKVGELTCEFANLLAINYYINYTPINKYGFEDSNQIDSIVGMILNLILAQLNRAIGMETLKQVNSTTQVIENREFNRPKQQQIVPSMTF